MTTKEFNFDCPKQKVILKVQVEKKLQASFMLYLLDAQESKFYATLCLRLVLAIKSKCV